jgi:hypothetical protein
MNFSWSKSKAEGRPSKKNPEELIAWFEGEIKRQDDIVYGTGLFFEGICILHAGQDGVIETYRKQFRNIIQTGKDVSKDAAVLLEQARRDASKVSLLEQFRFTFRGGQSDFEDIVKRAETLVATYQKLFPDRPRSQPLSVEESFRLIEDASGEFARIGVK